MSLASNIQSLATRVGTEMKNQNARLEALESAGSLDVSDLAARVTDLESADAAQDTLIAAAKTRADKGVSDAAAAASAASAAQATADTAKTTATTANTTANTLNETTVPNIAARVMTLEGAVKTAYDKAVSANNLAGTKTDPADVPVYAAPDYNRPVIIMLTNDVGTIMPDDGFLSLSASFNNTNGYCYIYNDKKGNNNYLWATGGAFFMHAGIIPVSKGMEIVVQSAEMSNFVSIFYYAKGVIQE